MKINLRESLNKIDLATDNKYDLLNTFDSKKLSDNSKKKLAEAIENNSIASINRVLHESKEQLYKVVIQSGATKRDFESALYEDEAEGIIDYYGGRWIDENGFEWDMYIEEDDDSSEHAMIDNSHNMENIDESLNEYYEPFFKTFNEFVSEVYGLKAEELDELDDDTLDKYYNDYREYIRNKTYSPHNKSLPSRYWEYGQEDANDIHSGESHFESLNESNLNEEDYKEYLSILDGLHNALVKAGGDGPDDDSGDIQNRSDGKVIYLKFNTSVNKFSNLQYKKIFDAVEFYFKNNTEFTNYVDVNIEKLPPQIPQDRTYKVYVSAQTPYREDESLNEASYGGAYDIEDDMFWTKDDLIEFSDAVCEKLADKFGYQYDIADVGEESNNDMYITIMDTTHDIEADVSFRIKMSRIRSPRDLMKYLDTVVSQFVKKFEEEYQYYDFDESLNEDVSKPDFVVGFYAGPVDDETLELVNPKKISQVDVSADELRAKYGKNVDKLLNDYTSQTVDKLKNGNSTLKAMILNFAEKKARETGELDNKFRNEERKFLETGIYMEKRLEEVNYPFEDGIKKLSKQLGKMLLPKRENLKEDYDEDESDFDDNEVEEGNHVFADGEEYVWVERIAGPIYLDFDKWAVWSARVFVDPRDFMTIHSDGKNYDFDGDAFKKKAMAAPIVYFVVEEDTGFIDWGPVESRIEAQDFLNGKQEDWDNDEYYGESLEKNLDEWYAHTIHYEDIGDGRAYDYEVDHEEVLDYLSEIAIDEEDAPEDTEEYLKWVEDNFDELFNKYEYEIEEHFREDASQEEYDRRHSSYEPEYSSMD